MHIPGPTGVLEANWHAPKPHPQNAVVCCHPHPQFGGSMHDAVLATARDALHPEGFASLAFNYRGVGTSDGSYDGGVGETDDALAALAWTHEQAPDARLWLLGYSFGAAVSWNAGPRADNLAGIILIAPPVARMPFADTTPACPVHAIIGSNDDFVSESELHDFLKLLPTAQHRTVPGANHFFGAQMPALAAALRELLFDV